MSRATPSPIRRALGLLGFGPRALSAAALAPKVAAAGSTEALLAVLTRYPPKDDAAWVTVVRHLRVVSAPVLIEILRAHPASAARLLAHPTLDAAGRRVITHWAVETLDAANPASSVFDHARQALYTLAASGDAPTDDATLTALYGWLMPVTADARDRVRAATVRERRMVAVEVLLRSPATPGEALMRLVTQWASSMSDLERILEHPGVTAPVVQTMLKRTRPTDVNFVDLVARSAHAERDPAIQGLLMQRRRGWSSGTIAGVLAGPQFRLDPDMFRALWREVVRREHLNDAAMILQQCGPVRRSWLTPDDVGPLLFTRNQAFQRVARLALSDMAASDEAAAVSCPILECPIDLPLAPGVASMPDLANRPDIE